MALECPACGGHMVFNVKINKLQCEYCDSVFEPDTYSKKNDGVVTKDIETMKMDRYSCKKCGAELCAPVEQIVSYCMYCGGESVLLEKASEIERPESIIPFAISKEEVKEQYEESLKGIHFVPKSFSKSKFIEGFRGIYIPYWRTRVHLKSQLVELEGKEITSSGSTTYTRYYDYNVTVKDKVIDSGVYDASSDLDDSLAATIAPFNEDSIVPFNASYLAGFYADKASTPVTNYDESIKTYTSKKVQKDLEELTEGVVTEEKLISEKVTYESENPRTSLFPIWFLTWRKRNRVAYSMMNGETGKLSAEIPVAYGKLFLWAFVAILVVFGILNLFPTFFLPLDLSCYASFILVFSTMFLNGRIKIVYLRENHIYDLGNNSYFKKNKNKSGKEKTNPLTKFLTFAQIGLLIFGGFLGTAIVDPSDINFFYKVMIIVQLITILKSGNKVFKIKSKIAIIPLVLSILIQISGVVLSGPDKPQDFWYLAITISCLVGMILNFLTCIYYINFMVTRPAPNFYSREGAKNDL